MIPVRLCILQFPDGEINGVITVGWHRIDGPDYEFGKDDGQDAQRQKQAILEADASEGTPFTIQFMDIQVPSVPFEVEAHELPPQ